MNNHLTEDQIARSILGEASAEQREHARHCLQCGAQLREFREAVRSFQSGMREWSDLETVPAVGGRESGWQVWTQPSLRWVLVGMAVIAVVVLPIYNEQDFESPTAASVADEAVNEDALLMQEVAMHLSRPLPISMERVMVLLPTDSAGSEREETR
jgi:hypothetical protein